MRYRAFPGTDLKVSEVGFGTWTLSTGWWGEKTDEEAVAMLRDSHSRYGINFFDTADTYGNGRGERQLAEAFRGRRDEVVYSTKIGYDIYDPAAQAARRGQSELPQKFDRDYMRFALDKCLERLETDHIDVLQLHNIKMEHVRDASIWSVLEQHPGTAMSEAARESAPEWTFNIRVTHASGMLEGKYSEETVFPANDYRCHRPRSWLTNGLRKIRTLDFLTTRMTLGQD